MENASNALLIGAGILIGIMVLSIGVYTYVNYSKVNEQYKQEQAMDELNKFNSNFTVFLNRKDVKAQEIITLQNLTRKYKEENAINITISFSGSDAGILNTDINKIINASTGKDKTKYKIEFLTKYSVKADNSGPITFTCKDNDIEYDNLTGRVKKIIFRKNS